jgi:hypothetical protein
VDVGARILGLRYGQPIHDADGAGTVIVGVALIALGLGVLIMNDGRRARIGGVLLMLWGVCLFFPGANGQ